MNQSLQKLKNFLTIDMWRLKSDDVSKPKYLLVSILKKTVFSHYLLLYQGNERLCSGTDLFHLVGNRSYLCCCVCYCQRIRVLQVHRRVV